MRKDPRRQASREERDSARAAARQVLKSRLESNAYHEAGHAVACYLLGRGPLCVSIVRQESHVGVCVPTPIKLVDDAGKLYPELAEQELLIGWAGTVAEGMMTGSFDAGAADPDWDRLLEIGQRLCGDRKQAMVYLCELEMITEDTFTLPPVKAAVEALAQQLLKRRFLRGHAARRVIRDALYNQESDA